MDGWYRVSPDASTVSPVALEQIFALVPETQFFRYRIEGFADRSELRRMARQTLEAVSWGLR